MEKYCNKCEEVTEYRYAYCCLDTRLVYYECPECFQLHEVHISEVDADDLML